MQILKIGGSVITKKKEWKKLDKKAILQLAKELSAVFPKLRKKLILVHGAGSFGHPLVIKYGLNNGVYTKQQLKNCKKVQNSCMELAKFIAENFIKNGVPAVVFNPHKLIVSSDKRIEKFEVKPVVSALKKGLLPILYGDMVPDKKLGYSVCSGDQIVAWLGKKADQIILASDVDGIYVKKKLIKKITINILPKLISEIGGSTTTDVTGGMAGKILEIAKSRKNAFIVNARKPKRIINLLLGRQTVCTKLMFEEGPKNGKGLKK